MAKTTITRVAAPDREAIASSAEFREFVELQKTEAHRRRNDRITAIEEQNVAVNRSLEDHNNFVLQTQTAINDLQALIADDDEIIAAVERMLTPRQAPTLSPHVNTVREALDAQQGDGTDGHQD